MTELAVPEHFVIPWTGEVLPATPDKAAEVLRMARLMKGDLNTLVKAASVVLMEESRRQGTKTLRYGGVKAEVKSGSEIEWDMEILERLHEAGLPESRWNELVKEEVTYKVSAAVAKQIEGSNPEYAEIIQAARGRREKDPYVSVS